MRFKKLLLRFLAATIQIVTSKKTLETARTATKYFTRERKMSFKDLVYFMLEDGKGSTQFELNRFLESKKIHISQQAYSVARSHFDHSPFVSLLNMTIEGFYTDGVPYKTFHGYRISAIDGTTLALPDTKELLKTYGGLGIHADSPAARVSIQYDILNDFIMDAQFEPLSVGERQLAKRHLDALCPLSKDLTIFDRGYASREFIELCIRKGICFLMRVKKGFNVNVDTLSLGVHTIVYHAHNLKVAKFLLPSGEIETLVTNLPESFTEEEYRKLYFLRWPIETKYDILKNKLELENFTGKTQNAILQDFYASMYLANMLSVALAQANEKVAEERASSDCKYSYKVNVNHAIGTFRDAFVTICLTDSVRMRTVKITKLLDALSDVVIPIRPDRSVPRPSSTRKSKFHHNRKANR